MDSDNSWHARDNMKIVAGEEGGFRGSQTCQLPFLTLLEPSRIPREGIRRPDLTFFALDTTSLNIFERFILDSSRHRPWFGRVGHDVARRRMTSHDVAWLIHRTVVTWPGKFRLALVLQKLGCIHPRGVQGQWQCGELAWRCGCRYMCALQQRSNFSDPPRPGPQSGVRV